MEPLASLMKGGNWQAATSDCRIRFWRVVFGQGSFGGATTTLPLLKRLSLGSRVLRTSPQTANFAADGQPGCYIEKGVTGPF